MVYIIMKKTDGNNYDRLLIFHHKCHANPSSIIHAGVFVMPRIKIYSVYLASLRDVSNAQLFPLGLLQKFSRYLDQYDIDIGIYHDTNVL